MEKAHKTRISIVHTGRMHDFGKGVRIRNIYDILSNSGFEVSTIACPHVDKSNIFSAEGVKNFLHYVFPPRISNEVPPGFSVESATRVLWFNIAFNFMVRNLAKLKPDVVLAETSLIGWVAVVAAKKFSIPCLIDVHGLAFAEAKGCGDKAWKQVALLEKYSFEGCDHLFVVSENMKEYLSGTFRIPAEKITVASNGSSCIQDDFAHYKDPLNVIYAGIFTYWEKIGDFLELAKNSNADKFRFFLAGDGPMREQILKRIRNEGIPVTYLGYVPRPKLQSLLKNMNIGVAPSTSDLARQVASPIKVFDYLASGLPVVTPKIGDWGQIIEKENCGIALQNDDIENYVNALNTLYPKGTWNEKSEHAICAIEEKYNWTVTLRPMTKILSLYN